MDDVPHPIRLPERLTDGVIVLDAHTLDDAEAHWRGEDAEMLRRFESPRKGRLDEIGGAIQRWIDMRAAGGPQVAYAMRDTTGVLMGGCELQRRSAACGHVSYWTFPAFRGRGYAARALALMLSAAAEAPGIERFQAEIADDNLASQQVVLKNGFSLTGESEISQAGATMLIYRRPARL
jgi:RimJ/RimL family protein N-acetyltransferase